MGKIDHRRMRYDVAFKHDLQVEVYAEIGEIMSGSKSIPKIPECGKNHYMFKSLGK